ncbi:MAG TPA: CHAT domain-containing protein [Stellaceae bacterium]|nr:CHAT domain-containing protein [Stellaceae bacterium]
MAAAAGLVLRPFSLGRRGPPVMRALLRPRFLFLLGLLALAGCGGAGGAAKADSADGSGLGQDLAGEQCRGVPRSGVLVPGVAPPFDIFCGEGKEAVGSLWTSAEPASIGSLGGAERREAVERAAREGVAGQSIRERLRCGDAQWLGSGDTALYTCTLRNGGWPQIVLVAGSGAALYQAEGLPTLWPVFLAAIEQREGRPLDVGDRAAVVARIEAASTVKGGRLGGGDVASFNDLTKLGRLYNSTHNFAASEDAYRRALEIQTRVFGPDAESVGATLIELALEVSNQGRYAEAAGLFRRADPIIQRSTDDALHARYYSYLALDAANQRKYQDALNYARESTAIRRKLAEGQGTAVAGLSAGGQNLGAKGELVHSLRVEAAMALRLGEFDDAEAAITEALSIMSEVRGLPLAWRVEALALLGDIDAANHRNLAAERDYNAAVALSRKLFGNTAPTAQALIKLGRFEAYAKKNAEAVAAYRAALDILVRDEVAQAELVPDEVTPFFDAAAALAAADPSQREALSRDMFRLSQLINSDVTDQTISRASARLATGDPAIQKLIRETQEAERDRDTARLVLANEQAKPDNERGSILENELEKRVTDANAKVAALQKSLEQAFPTYVGFRTPDVAGLARLQQFLAPDEAFLTFVIGHQHGYVMLVRHENAAVRPVEINEEQLTEAVTKLRRGLTPRLGTVPEFDLAGSYALYKKLIGPVEAQLNGVNHLIVAPTGALASLPFALFVTEQPAPRGYQSAQWLVRRTALSEVPSARAFIDLRKARAHAKPAPRAFLGLGNPSFVGGGESATALERLAETCRSSGPVPSALIRALPPLPESADEVRRVGQRLNADSSAILLGAAASETNLRHQALQDYNVLYFATHGLLPGELECDSEPGLALSPPAGEATSTDDDGLLDATEVAKLNLNAELVVLSACNTAAGGGRLGGEALAGLAEAFFYAGARTLVASHWQVPSRATATLMVDMFDKLGPRLAGGVAESLRRAQLAVAGDPATAQPFYWAAFTVIGDGGLPGAGASTEASLGGDAPGKGAVKP